ncbi:hypothetical protein [Actinoplanes auranticolor]|uniref:Uncharacterized protein n=1 Tax=Actinoplanes auranticolor TaxID=47988 RepID=A0A919VK70_9ACTN|nr:hypothetical protein [Actinoplanes auranticolor]GIM65844.1 hypothetical protein Aau02nite_20160 [Actinoplanes auranticolor]
MPVRERGTPVVVGLLLLTVLLLSMTVTPFVLVVAGIWALVWRCRRHVRRSAEPGGVRTGLEYHLHAVGILYLVPIGIAATFYCLLATYLRLFGDTIGAGRLGALQRTFEATSTFFTDRLKLSELAVLTGVYLLTCALLDREPDDPGPGRGWRRRVAATAQRSTAFYTRFSGPAAAGLATLAAFTLFGMQLGVPSDDLRLRLKVAQRGYAEVTRQIEADLNRRVADQLWDKVHESLPPSYRAALRRESTISDLLDEVRVAAERARSTHGVSVAAIDKMIADETARRNRMAVLPAELRVPAQGRTELPPGVTPERVAAARAAVGESPQPGIDLVADGRRTVTLQLEKVVSERIVALLKPFIASVPMIEPLVQAFAEVADTTLQERMGTAYDRLVKSALSGRGQSRPGGSDVVAEARAIVEQTDVSRAVERAAPDAERAATTRRLLMTSLAAGSTTIDRTVAETLARRTPPPPRSGKPGGPKVPLKPLPPLNLPRLIVPPPLPRIYDYGGPGYRPGPQYRPPPRYAPPRPVRPPVRIIPFI